MNFATSPAFSLPQTKRTFLETKNDQNLVGPVYNTFGLGKKSNSISYGIGKSNRYNINHGTQQSPSPGQYNPEKHFIEKKISFTKAGINSNQRNQDEQTPDPGCYMPNYNTIKAKCTSYSMGSKYSNNMDSNNNVPGPGHYQTMPVSPSNSKKKSLGKSKSTLFGNSNRFKSTGNLIPGPGDYQVTAPTNLINKQGKFGTGPKNSLQSNQIPGPNSYEFLSCFDQAIKNKLGKSIAGRYDSEVSVKKGQSGKKHSQVNKDQQQHKKAKKGDLTYYAFGKYEVQKQYKKLKDSHPKFSIGNSKRKLFQESNLPGPSDYIKETYEGKNTFRASIATSRKDPYNDALENPGPGTYTATSQNAASYSIPRSKSTNLFNSNPGVGRYDVTKKQKVKGAVFQNSNRVNFVSKNSAGVGDYQIQRQQKQKISIAKAERFARQQAHKPGPGDYHIPSSLGKFNNYGKVKSGKS